MLREKLIDRISNSFIIIKQLKKWESWFNLSHSKQLYQNSLQWVS